MIGEKNEELRDELKHRFFNEDTVVLYQIALRSLMEEGNKAAKIAHDAIFNGLSERGYIDPTISFKAWAWNIHNNTWGENSFAGIIKARVVVMRIRGRGDETKP